MALTSGMGRPLLRGDWVRRRWPGKVGGMTGRESPSSAASRIKRLLASSDLTKAELASVLDLPSGITIDAVLAGGHELSATDLVAAADVLDVPVTVLTGQLPMDQHLGVSLRLGTIDAPDVPAEALQSAEMHLRYRALLDSWLEPPGNPMGAVSMSTDNFYIGAGRESARRVRDALGLGDSPIPDLVDLVELLDFPVIFQPLPVDMHGLNVRDEREGIPTRVIVISSCGPWTLQRYTLAHELCHGLYDDPGQVIVDCVDTPEVLPELRAEQFARHLLLPAGALRREVRQALHSGKPWHILIPQLMVQWGMSRRAIVRALCDDGLAGADELKPVESYPIADLMARAGLTEEWERLCAGQEEASGSPLLVSRAVEAYGKGWVDLHVVADLLGQDLQTTERELTEKGWTAPDGVPC